MTKSRTIRLDPRTNDPYLDKSGKLVMATIQELIGQRFDILVHTMAGSDVFNPSYGLDYKWVKNNTNMKQETAFFLELTRKIDERVEPILNGFDIIEMSSSPDRKMVTAVIEVKGSNGDSVIAEVVTQ